MTPILLRFSFWTVGIWAPGAMLPAPSVQHPIAVVTSAERVAHDASRWTLKVDIDVPKGLHVYAQDASGYHGAVVKVDAPAMADGPVRWPEPSDLLFAMSQPVKVYEGKATARIDVILSRAQSRALRSGRHLTVTGVLHYQSCTEDACYRPRDLKLSWRISARAAASPRRAS